MTSDISFNIHVLGLVDATSPGRTRFVEAMQRLTGRGAAEFEESLPPPKQAVFRNLDLENAQIIAASLGDAGVLIEISPQSAVPAASDSAAAGSMSTCPACSFVQPAGGLECASCGIVFAKYEREEVFKMEKNRFLEEAMARALQVREEWVFRAKQFIERNPFPEDATEGFDKTLMTDEVPFLRLTSDEGPVLLTSRRVLALVGRLVLSIPYEIINDVNFGGGLKVSKKKVRMQFGFPTPLPFTVDKVEKTLSWQLDKESSFNKDVIMDWAFSREFLCGGCGERDFQFRTEGIKVSARCMRCATDHEIDMRQSMAVPIEEEEEEQ